MNHRDFMNEREIIAKYYTGLQRLGPGSEEDTLRAFELTGLKENEALKVADIGCGTGASTLALARRLRNSQITAVDLFPEFLIKLSELARSQEIKNIKTQQVSMDALTFKDEELDLIWSEGAIYNIGFKNGVQQWRKYLKKRGLLAVSEITWTTRDRPKEIEDIWASEYPEISLPSKKIIILEDSGYQLQGYFQLGSSSWLSGYYNPQKLHAADFASEYPDQDAVRDFVDGIHAEIAQYEKFQDFYTYGFYIASKL